MSPRMNSRKQAGVVSVLLCLAVAGCGGADEAGGDPTAGGSDSSDACVALDRFSISFQATVDAVQGGDAQQVRGAVARLKDEYINVAEALQEPAPEAYDLMTTAMGDLSAAVASLPREPSAERVATGVGDFVTAVDDAVQEAQGSLACPSA